MNNFTEDLTGLSRADLVYKAKLAEQAERCAFRSPACPYHFRQKFTKSILAVVASAGARLAREGRGPGARRTHPPAGRRAPTRGRHRG